MIVINIRVQVFKSEAQDWTQQMSTKQRLCLNQSSNLLPKKESIPLELIW